MDGLNIPGLDRNGAADLNEALGASDGEPSLPENIHSTQPTPETPRQLPPRGATEAIPEIERRWRATEAAKAAAKPPAKPRHQIEPMPPSHRRNWMV